ncbi:MAG: hypothetical protein AMJ81_09730 [Phycisphaerae bacterium SM23_33]|jgi:sugar phosphate isomerase/epimerase|nr:MAG: hypothetical protein AMJ81_09730 [Phycisphaerae bacterium SM23_33]
MNITWTLFPKFYRHLSAEQLAGLVREVGLDNTTVVIRQGYWVTPENLAAELPAFVRSLRRAGIEPHWATAGFMPRPLLSDPAPLAILADNGLREFRMGQWQFRGVDVRAGLAMARREMQQLAPVCEQYGVRCVHQLHHDTLVSTAAGIYQIVEGLPARHVGVALDPGNQAHDGMENWQRSARLLGEYLCGLGVKDTALVRDPARADEPDKGWRRTWCPLYEGVTNWHEVVGALADVDFNGTFVWMPFYDPDNPDVMTRKLKREVAYLKGVVDAVTRAA